MKFKMQIVLSSLVVLSAVITSCTTNPVSSGINEGSVTVSMKGVSPNITTVAKKTQPALSNATGLVTLESAIVVIKKIKLENSLKGALDFKFNQPFVQDLFAIDNQQVIETLQIPFGSYDKIKVKIDDLDPKDGDVFTQNPDLQNLSILLKGYLNDDPSQTFEFSSDISLEIKVNFDPPLEINETTVATNIVLEFDFSVWFTDENGELIDPNDPANQKLIERNIRKSIKVFEDKDKDGHRDDDFEVKGTIDEIGTDADGRDSLVVSGTTFFVDANTRIEDDNKNLISFSDLSAGMFVEVHAVQQADGTWLATKIEIEDDHKGDDHDFEVKGTIDEIGTDADGRDSLVVSGTTFFVDANTRIEDDDKNLISFSDLSAGMFVEVHAVQQSDGTWLATKIEIEDDHKGDDHDFEVKGTIDEIGTDADGKDFLVVSGTTFFVDANTRIEDDNKNLISFSDLSAGMVVEVHAVQQADGTWLATKIEVEN